MWRDRKWIGGSSGTEGEMRRKGLQLSRSKLLGWMSMFMMLIVAIVSWLYTYLKYN